MSEDVKQTANNENPAPQWDFVLKQLEKVQGISKTVNLSNFRIRSLEKDVQLIKQIDQVDQNSQGQLDKKDNVINDDTKSLPSTLSQNQRKRYQSIGNEFVKGAGNEFQKIKKALKLKQQMQTKKQQFEKSAKKVEETVKSTNKKKGFWVKFLGIVAVLSLVAILFRDKIAKLLPDLSANTGSLTQRIGAFFYTMLQQMFTFTTGALGGIFTSTIKYACTNVLPNLVNLFFTETLPMAMLASTLAVMSMFSSSAGEQLESLLGKSTQRQTDTTADAAEAKLSKQQTERLKRYHRFSEEYIKELQAENDIYMARTMVDSFALAMMQRGQGAFSKANDVLNSIGGLSRDNSNDVSLSQLISSGAINFTAMLRLIDQLNKDKSLLDSERRHKFQQFIRNSLKQSHTDFNQSDVIAMGEQFSKGGYAALSELATSMMNSTKYQKLNKIAFDVNVPNPSDASITTVTQPTELPLITNIQVGQILQYAIAEKIYNVLSSIDTFLNHKETGGILKQGIIQFFGKLRSTCVDHLISPFDVFAQGMKRAFESLSVNYNKELGNKNTGLSDDGGKTVIQNSNILMVQLNFDDTFTTTFGSALQSMLKNSNDTKIVMQRCNNQMAKINAKFLGFVHTKLGLKTTSNTVQPTQAHVDETISGLGKRVLNNEEAIKGILQKLKETPAEAQQGTANPIKQS